HLRAGERARCLAPLVASGDQRSPGGLAALVALVARVCDHLSLRGVLSGLLRDTAARAPGLAGLATDRIAVLPGERTGRVLHPLAALPPPTALLPSATR